MRSILLSLSLLLVLTSCDNVVVETKLENKAEAEKTEATLLHPDWAKNATIYEANIRQITAEGTFKALEAKLPEIKELGVNIIWLMPIQAIGEKNRKGGMGSYYSVRDYTVVNPEFGSLEDLNDFVQASHALGMKVILDWVANHTAWDHPWTESHPEYYTKDSLGNFQPPVADWSDVIDLDYDNKEMRQEMIDAMAYWIKTSDVDGFRCDVAGMVPTDFWNDARAQLDAIKPVFMLAEAEQEDLHKAAFDMSYGWELMHIMNHIAKDDTAFSAQSVHDYLLREQERFGEDDYRMFFLTNHDENSWNGTIEERYGEAEKAYAILAFTIHGMPLIYSGQEYGNNKRLEFFEKDAPNFSNPELFEFYKTLMHLNIEEEALWNGAAGGRYEFIENDHPETVVSYKRSKNDSEIMAIINLSPEAKKIKLKGMDTKTMTNVFTGEKVSISSEQDIDLEGFAYLLVKN